MTITDRNSAIEAYLAATANEIHHDRHCFEREGFQGTVPPRAHRLVDHLRRRQWLVSGGVHTAMAISPVLLSAWFRLCYRKMRHLLPEKPRPFPEGRAIVGFATHVDLIVGWLPEEDRPETLLTVPGFEVLHPKRFREVRSILDPLHREDLDWALGAAEEAAGRLAEKVETPTDRLQAYTAFNWMLVWRALERGAERLERLMFSNHYDRWSVLFDRLDAPFGRSMIQHGILPPIVFPERHGMIDTLYHFAVEGQAEAFRRMVFRDGAPLKTVPIRPAITLTELAGTGARSILLIGQPNHYGHDAAIAQALLEGGGAEDIDLFFKPHPLSDEIGRFGFPAGCRIIEDKLCFPKVDVVGSAGSTLGIQYELCGIPSLNYLSMTPKEAAAALAARATGR